MISECSEAGLSGIDRDYLAAVRPGTAEGEGDVTDARNVRYTRF